MTNYKKLREKRNKMLPIGEMTFFNKMKIPIQMEDEPVTLNEVLMMLGDTFAITGDGTIEDRFLYERNETTNIIIDLTKSIEDQDDEILKSINELISNPRER